MQGFQDFLKNKYSVGELSSTFDIIDINNFNYRDLIISRGMEETWNQRPFNHGLAAEFFLFQSNESRKFFEGLVNSAKNYANSKYAKDFLISFNTADFVNFGHFILDIGDYQ